MPEIDHLTEPSGGFELGFVEREEIPQPVMQFSIHLHAADPSLSDTVPILDNVEINWCRTMVHN